MNNLPAWARFYNDLKAEVDAGKWGATDVHTLMGVYETAVLFTGVSDPHALVDKLMAGTGLGPIYYSGGLVLGKRVIHAAPIGGDNTVMAIIAYGESEDDNGNS